MLYYPQLGHTESATRRALQRPEVTATIRNQSAQYLQLKKLGKYRDHLGGTRIQPASYREFNVWDIYPRSMVHDH
jgi:hypothetical protein